MQINPIEQRPGNSLPITLDLKRSTSAFAFEITKITARAWVHRRHQHEFGWKRDASGCARHRHFAILDWLSHHLERERLNSGNSSRKRNAIMARLTSPGAGMVEPPNKPTSEIVMMRRAERARRERMLFAVSMPANAMDLRTVDCFL
jgi:hypothetical protein